MQPTFCGPCLQRPLPGFAHPAVLPVGSDPSSRKPPWGLLGEGSLCLKALHLLLSAMVTLKPVSLREGLAWLNSVSRAQHRPYLQRKGSPPPGLGLLPIWWPCSLGWPCAVLPAGLLVGLSCLLSRPLTAPTPGDTCSFIQDPSGRCSHCASLEGLLSLSHPALVATWSHGLRGGGLGVGTPWS